MKAKNIGIDVKAPKETCEDNKCPFHGHVRVRTRTRVGKVINSKVHQSITIEQERIVKIPKYERSEKRRTRIKAHNPPCIDAREGDIVRVYATDLPAKLDFKKKRLEKRDQAAEDAAKAAKEAQKTLAEKAKDQLKGKKEEEKAAEEKAEEIIEKAEEKSGVPEKVAEKEAELDVKETKKAEEKKK